MPTRIRLQRKGKKGQPFYHLVVADGRAPRDGKYIEKLGTYNPMTNPATIDINFDRSLYWLQVGAQPSDTAKSILSHKGVLLKDHLLKGMKKGALTEDQVEAKFQAWISEKEEKLQQSIKDKELAKKDDYKTRLENERKVKEARAEEIAKKLAAKDLKAEKAAVAETQAEEAPVAETPVEEAPVAETPVEEAPVAETPVEEAPVAETPVEEAPVAETPVEESPVAETPVEEAPVAETPVEESPVAETPAEEAPVAETPAEEAPEEKKEE